MKIKEVTDKKIWEKFISDYSPVSLFQSWNWGEAIRKLQIIPLQRDPANGGTNYKLQILWRLGVYDDNNLVGIAQVVKVIAKRGTFLHIRHGPILREWKKE